MKKKLHSLKTVSQMVLDTELAKLRDLTEQLTAKSDEISALRQAGRDRVDGLSHGSGDDLAFVTGQDQRYGKWLEARIREINTDIANLAAAREHQLALTRRAFGRTSALDQLAKKAHKP